MSKITPTPYVAGQTLDLVVTRAFDDRIRGGRLPVTITKAFDVTQSPVMAVTFNSESGPVDAVLKLYDRRFGQSFRKIGRSSSTHTSDDELAWQLWQEYVRNGRAISFFRELDEEEATALVPPNPAHKHNNSPEGRAQYEGGLQRQALKYFKNETRTYEKLADLQGAYIPMMLAHVRLSQPRLGHQPPETEHFSRIQGILMQRIDTCCSLEELAESQDAPSEQKLQEIVQMATDEAAAINDRGILMHDCRPGNVLVERKTRQPFIHDFAQCYFEEEDPDNEDVPFGVSVIEFGNPRAIGMVMETVVRQKLGYQLHINYPY